MRIKRITVINNLKSISYEVGINKVTLIEDRCMEWDDGIDFMYSILDFEGNRIAEIENCPVVVEYYT